MIKQEWVQKYLEDILDEAWRLGVDGKGIDATEEANKARFHLTKWGVVIKVDREPKYIPELCAVNLVEGRGFPRCMADAGYVEVEPLIEEV